MLGFVAQGQKWCLRSRGMEVTMLVGRCMVMCVMCHGLHSQCRWQLEWSTGHDSEDWLVVVVKLEQWGRKSEWKGMRNEFEHGPNRPKYRTGGIFCVSLLGATCLIFTIRHLALAATTRRSIWIQSLTHFWPLWPSLTMRTCLYSCSVQPCMGYYRDNSVQILFPTRFTPTYIPLTLRTSWERTTGRIINTIRPIS